MYPLDWLRFRRVCGTRCCIFLPTLILRVSLQLLHPMRSDVYWGITAAIIGCYFYASSQSSSLGSCPNQSYLLCKTGTRDILASLVSSPFSPTLKYLPLRSDLLPDSWWRRSWDRLIYLLKGLSINDALLIFFFLEINHSVSLFYPLLSERVRDKL